MKSPRTPTGVKGELRPLRLTAFAFEGMLMPILHRFTSGNANVTINPNKKANSLTTMESFHLSVFQVALASHAAANRSLQSSKHASVSHIFPPFCFLLREPGGLWDVHVEERPL